MPTCQRVASCEILGPPARAGFRVDHDMWRLKLSKKLLALPRSSRCESRHGQKTMDCDESECGGAPGFIPLCFAGGGPQAGVRAGGEGTERSEIASPLGLPAKSKPIHRFNRCAREDKIHVVNAGGFLDRTFGFSSFQAADNISGWGIEADFNRSVDP